MDNVSFDIGEGEFLALIGPNGAGKIDLLQHDQRPDAPDRGDSPFRRPQHRRYAAARRSGGCGIGRTFQIAATFGSMTRRENIQLALASHHGEVFRFGTALRAASDRSARALLDQVGMAEAADRACKELAYGDVKRVELAIALANDPRLLLMDEPTAGMAPRERNDLIALVKRLVRREQHLRAVHRAFHGRGVRLCRPHHCARARRADRRRQQRGHRDNRDVQQVYLGTGRTFAAR